MSRTLLVLVFLSGFVLPVAAQTPDTLAAHRYVPLEVGNEWHYENWRPSNDETHYPLVLTSYERITIEAEVEMEGAICYEIKWRLYSASGNRSERVTSFVRFDEDVQNVVSCDEDHSWMAYNYLSPCPLSADFDSFVECEGDFFSYVKVGGGAGTVHIGDDEVEVTRKSFIPSVMEVLYLFASDIGLVARYDWYNEFLLVYARIGDMEYGSPVPVSAEPAPIDRESFNLTVFPNPASGSATATFTLDTSQEVTLELFDLLGRRLARYDLGIVSSGDLSVNLDLSGLSAGMFILRATSSSGILGTTRLVHTTSAYTH